MENDFIVEEILDMPIIGEGSNEPILIYMDCVGQNELYKVVSTPTGAQSQTGDYKEPDYIDADNESHGECNHELFCITGKDSDYIDIDSIFDDKVVI